MKYKSACVGKYYVMAEEEKGSVMYVFYLSKINYFFFCLIIYIFIKSYGWCFGLKKSYCRASEYIRNNNI